MSISSVGSMPLNSISFGAGSAPVQHSSTADNEIPAFIADGFGASVSGEISAPDRSQIMKAMQSSSAAPSAADGAQPQDAEVLQSAKADSSMPTAQTAKLEMPGPDATTDDIAAFCNAIAKSDASVAERTELITQALTIGIEKADTPHTEWTRATPQQLKLYVQETLEHVDAVRQIGQLRGLDFDSHDLEPKTGKFEPRIAQYLALPGREDSVKWSISEHNASPHHATWKNPNASVEDLSESASDIVNAWRMNRRVYSKPSWSWERIADVIDAQFQNNELSAVQREALLQAIPFQMEWESKFGLPA